MLATVKPRAISWREVLQRTWKEAMQDDILGLQDDLAAERARTASLRRQLHHEQGYGQDPPGEGPGAG